MGGKFSLNSGKCQRLWFVDHAIHLVFLFDPPYPETFRDSSLGGRINSDNRRTMGSCMIKKDSRLDRAGVTGFNQPKRTPDHPKKSHIVVAKEGSQIKTIRFGEQGANTAGKPREGEPEAMKKKRASFKARHSANIAKGKMSAAFWADKEKW